MESGIGPHYLECRYADFLPSTKLKPIWLLLILPNTIVSFSLVPPTIIKEDI